MNCGLDLQEVEERPVRQGIICVMLVTCMQRTMVFLCSGLHQTEACAVMMYLLHLAVCDDADAPAAFASAAFHFHIDLRSKAQASKLKAVSLELEQHHQSETSDTPADDTPVQKTFVSICMVYCLLHAICSTSLWQKHLCLVACCPTIGPSQQVLPVTLRSHVQPSVA